MATVTVKYGRNILDITKDVLIEHVEGITLNEILVKFSNNVEELTKTKIFVYKNSVKILYKDWADTLVEEGDLIDIIPYVGDPFTVVTAIGLGSSFWSLVAVGGVAALEIAAGYYAYDYGRDYIKELMKTPDIDWKGDTQTYSWQGATTTANEGVPIPIIYGSHMVGGNVIGELIEYTGDYDASLDVMLALGEAPLGSINTDDTFINDQPASSFNTERLLLTAYTDGTSTGVSSYVAPIGSIELPYKTDSDGVFIGDDTFFDIAGKYEEYYNNTGLVTSWYPAEATVDDFKTLGTEFYNEEWYGNYTTEHDNIDALYLNFSFTGYIVPIAIRYALIDSRTEEVSDSDWIYYGATWIWNSRSSSTSTGPVNDEGERPVSTSYSYKSYICTTASRTDYPPYLFEWINRYSYITYGGVNCLFGNKVEDNPRRKLKTIKLTGPTTFVRTKTVQPLSRGQYVRVQVKRLDLVKEDSVSLDSITEVYGSDSYNYDTAMVKVHFDSANETISGSVPNFKFPVTGIDIVRVYDETFTPTTQWSNNPVWCLCDLLTNKRYGLGEWFTYDDIDLETAVETATFCDDNDLTCNIVLDTSVSVSEGIEAILETFNGFFVYGANRQLKILADKPETVRQVFSRSNIIEGSLSYTFGSKQSEFNALEIRYSDAEDDFKQHAVFMSLNFSPLKEQSLVLRGVTNLEQATYVGSYKLQKAYRCNETVSFKTNYDAIACEAGAVIGIQDFSISSEIYGGRIISSTSISTARHCVLDQDIGIDTGEDDYSILYTYVHPTNGVTSATVDVTSYDSETRTIVFTASSFPTTVDEGSNSVTYAVFLSSSDIDKFRIVSIKQNTEERTFEIAAVKYDEQIYDPSQLLIREIPEDVESETKAYPVRNVYMERTVDFTGAKIWFEPPTSHYRNYSTCRIDYQAFGDTTWTYVASMRFANGYVVSGLKKDTYYTFRFTSINTSGQANTAQAVYYTLYSSGTIYPPDVTGLQVAGRGNDNTFVGRDCSFIWNAVATTAPGDLAIIGYVIEIWVEGICVRREHVADNVYTYYYTANVEDNGNASHTFTIKVWAENNAHVLSQNAAELEVTNVSTLTPTNLVANFDGRDCVFVWEAPASTIWVGFNIEVYSEYNLGGTLLREDTVYDTKYIFRYEYNTTSSREISARVRTVDEFGQVSEWVERNATNTAPSTVTGLIATGVLGGVSISWNAPEISYDLDIIGYNIYAALDSTATSGDFHSFVNGTSRTITSINDSPLSSGDVVWVRVTPVDSFGEGDFDSSPSAHATVQGVELESWSFDVPLTSGIDFSAAAGTASWTTGTLTFGGETHTIPAGSTTDDYILWSEDNPEEFTTFESTPGDEQPTIDSHTWVMAYFDGNSVWQAAENKIIHGGLIQAGTITAEFGEIDYLSSIATETGGLTVDASGYLRGGMDAYESGSGFWMGYDVDTWKFMVQGASGDYLKFDGDTVTIKGTLEVTSSDWGLPIDSNTQMLFHFNNSFKSTKGQDPVTSVASLRGDGWFGGCVAIETGTTNLLGSNSGFEVGTQSGWSFSGGTQEVLSNALDVCTGNYSMRCLYSSGSSGDYARTDAVAVTVGQTYTASAMIKTNLPTGTVVLAIDWFDNGSSLLSSSVAPLATFNTYKHYYVSGTAPASTVYARVRIYVNTAGLSGVIDFDDVQLEQKAYATSHVTGGTTRSSGQLSYSYPTFPRTGSFAARVRLGVTPTANVYLMDFQNPRVSIYYTAAGVLTLAVGGLAVATLPGLSWTVGNWYMVTVSWDFDNNQWLVGCDNVFGTLGTTSRTWSDPSTYAVYFGSTYGVANQLNGSMDEVRIDSIARSESELSVWAITTAEFVDPNAITNTRGTVIINDEGILVKNGAIIVEDSSGTSYGLSDFISFGEEGYLGPQDYASATFAIGVSGAPTAPYWIGDKWFVGSHPSMKLYTCVIPRGEGAVPTIYDWVPDTRTWSNSSTTPPSPYYLGDLWVRSGDIYECIYSVAAGGSSSTSHWTMRADKTSDNYSAGVGSKAADEIGRTFRTTTSSTYPTPPYSIGDTWYRDSSGGTESWRGTYTCIIARTSGSYVSGDFVRLGDITSVNTSNNTSNVGTLASGTISGWTTTAAKTTKIYGDAIETNGVVCNWMFSNGTLSIASGGSLNIGGGTAVNITTSGNLTMSGGYISLSGGYISLTSAYIDVQSTGGLRIYDSASNLTGTIRSTLSGCVTITPPTSDTRGCYLGTPSVPFANVGLYGDTSIILRSDSGYIQLVADSSYISMYGPIRLYEVSGTVPTPGDTYCYLYAKSDGSYVRPYYKLSNGGEYCISHT